MAEIKTPQQAQELAQRFVQNAQDKTNEEKSIIQAAFDGIQSIDPNAGGFEELAVLLALPDESFSILAPAFLGELNKSLNSVDDQLAIVQALNVAGIKAEDVEEEYAALCESIDKEMGAFVSAPKRDFLKQLMGMTYNAVCAAEGIAKRRVIIPFELCREGAKKPTYAHVGDAGMDVYAAEDMTLHPGETKLVPLGIKCAIPLGYELQIRPRSGMSLKTKMRIANSVATIDSSFRGEICVIAENIDQTIRSAKMDDAGRLTEIEWGSDIVISKGDRIAQMVLSEVPTAILQEVGTISPFETTRGEHGFGSSGNS